MAKRRTLPDGMWQRGDVYYARFRAGGREVRKRLSTDFRAACEILRDLRARADRADFALIDNDYPWGALRDEFLAWAKQGVRNPEDYASDIKRFEEYAAIKNVREITVQHMVGFRAWRLAQADNATPRTVNRQVGTIHNLLNKAVAWRRIGWNPIKGLKPLPHDKLSKERRPLSVDEVLRLLAVSSDRLRPVWRMFLCTGIRHNELVNMTFADVDFERRVVTVRASRAKNHKAREIPLDDTLLATIAALKSDAQDRHPVVGRTPDITERQLHNFSRDRVFVTGANTPWRNHLLERFYAACKAAEIEGAHPNGTVDIHSLRVSFTTLTIEHGANPKDVQSILGHGTLKMTMGIYSKATERGKRSAISALPFANARAPQHLVALQDAHKVRTDSGDGTEGLADKRLA